MNKSKPFGGILSLHKKIISLEEKYNLQLKFKNKFKRKYMSECKKNIELNSKVNKFDVIILAVPHKKFSKFNFKKVNNILINKKKSLVMDIKGTITDKKIKNTFNYWSL